MENFARACAICGLILLMVYMYFWQVPLVRPGQQTYDTFALHGTLKQVDRRGSVYYLTLAHECTNKLVLFDERELPWTPNSTITAIVSKDEYQGQEQYIVERIE